MGIGAAVAAGVAAYAAGQAGSTTWKTVGGIAGGLAALLALLQTFLTAEDRSLVHYKKGHELEGIAIKARGLREQGSVPQAELDKLVNAKTRIESQPPTTTREA
jgi:hypothetical protein